MAKNEKKKTWVVDFTQLNVEVTIDKFVTKDISKPLGNYIHQCTEDIGIDDLAHDIYRNGKCEMNEEQAAVFVDLVKKSTIEPYIRRPLIDLIMNVKT